MPGSASESGDALPEIVGGPVGFIGLGAMGARMVRRLIDRGVTVVAYDTRPEAVAAAAEVGAKPADSARAVGDAAATVMVSLPTPEVVRAVACDEGLAAGSAIRTFVDLSTTGPVTTEEVAARLAEAGVAYVDAPVSGGTKGAEAGTLAVMASGDPDTVAATRPLLETFGPVFVVGPVPGQGQVAKIANNMLSATAIVATTEAVLLGVSAGLDPKVLLDVVNAGSGRNTASADKFPRAVLSGTYDVGFRLALMAKDLRLCRNEADRRHTPMLLGNLVEQVWSLTEGQYSDDADCMRIVELFEQWAGKGIRP